MDRGAYLKALRKIIRGGLFQTLSSTALMVALFGADVAQVYQVPTNDALDLVLSMALCFFSLEFMLQLLSEADYPLSFFFWMDIIGTLSMIFDISFMFGTDVTRPRRLWGKRSTDAGGSAVIVRAARAARLGARAGRLSRVIKILRFMPFMSGKSDDDGKEEYKMAKVISKQLNDAIAMRVALVIIAIAVLLPIFSLTDYPETDGSLMAWTQILDASVEEYSDAVRNHQHSSAATAKAVFQAELQRCSDFYSTEQYGPFKACKEIIVHGKSVCQPTLELPMAFNSHFDTPKRRSSIWIMHQGHFQLYFSLVTPKKQESLANIGLICFIIFMMICFGLLMSANVSELALKPLERMLSIVREKCAQIFKFAGTFQDNSADYVNDNENGDENKKTEIDLLESAVAKLTAIARVFHENQMPEWTENMDENDEMKLNMAGHITHSDTQANRHSSLRSRTIVRRTHGVSSSIGPGRGSIQCDVSAGFAGHVRQIVDELTLDTIGTDEFNSVDLKDHEAQAICELILCTSQGSSQWVEDNVEQPVLHMFVKLAKAMYKGNAFHNFAHSLDVCGMVDRYLTLINGGLFFSEEEVFAVGVAAVGHDLGHIGVNNQYLIETAHSLAVTYNDRSPLENMHCAQLFNILKNDEANVFSALSKPNYKEIRTMLIGVILHTDMIHHMAIVKEAHLLYCTNEEAFEQQGGEDPENDLFDCLGVPANHQLVLNMLLHTADVNNPMKPWELCRRLALLCMDEYFAQGDLEKQAGMPVGMLNDREKVNIPNSQIGFVEFMIAPLAQAVVEIFPGLLSLATHLSVNISNWCDVWVQEYAPTEEELEKTAARVKKVCDKCVALTPERRSLRMAEAADVVAIPGRSRDRGGSVVEARLPAGRQSSPQNED